MKKNLIILLLSFLSLGKAISQTPDLVVEVPMGFPSSYNGVYVYTGKFNNRPYWVGPKSANNMVICYSKMYTRFVYTNFYNDTTSLMWASAYDMTGDTSKIPTNGWNQIKVSINGPSIKFKSLVIKEVMDNDGSFTETIDVFHNKLEGHYFAGTVGEDFVASGKVTISNLVSGLTAKLVKQNDSTLSMSLTGKASDHAVDTNFQVSFTNAALAGGGKIDSTYGVNTTLKINFINVVTVGASGADYTTVKAGLLAVKTDDILKIFEGTYTEDSIVNASGVTNLTIMGAGVSKTIIQGATQPFAGGKNGVFSISAAEVHFHDLTIQNGDKQLNGGGSAIRAANKLYIHNCRIVNNRTLGKLNYQVQGGAILAIELYMYNSEVSGNIVDNESKTGSVMGGGVYGYQIYMENTTVSGNFSRTDGGGVLVGNNLSKFINCTITNNTAETGKGGGICTYGINNYTNSIIWGNNGFNGKDIHEINGHVYPIYPVKSFIGDVTAIQNKTPLIVGNYYNVDPKLDTLKFNCSDTRTHALLSGSIALDSGVYADTIPSLDQRGFPILGSKDIGAQESVNRLIFDIAKDTICAESKDVITLVGSPANGVFTGDGVSGNTFDVSKVTTTGYVKIKYSYNATGCNNLETTDSIFVRVCTPSSVNDLALPVSIYPNPTKNLLVVKSSVDQPLTISITSVSGVVVLNQSSQTSETLVDMTNFTSGIYFITVKAAGKIANHKIIKQ